ncbi:MarR family winged helix-turn-helix transcriptional regulator [Leekyejoonella antrihumi]|uniref:MarR family transcriptional regulator n=1 Tax=Leekyejoonella antrihumi TaxID=1660198 RepID=A0A563DXJ3_9MICO|nr:MarR family transcriptional regulator [Leekyejoonella antrihumi]TWP34701.1 MarR family transcriptional regulator [Leekyejoonella antrihumi]
MSDGEIPWLTEDEQTSWRNYLRASRALEAALDNELQNAGLSLAEYELISMLSEAPDQSMRMSELAALIVQSRSRVTHTANRLAGRGWVVREPCADDRRGIRLVLTDTGRAAIERASRVHVVGVRQHFLSQLEPGQFQAVGDAMGRVREHLL